MALGNGGVPRPRAVCVARVTVRAVRVMSGLRGGEGGVVHGLRQRHIHGPGDGGDAH